MIKCNLAVLMAERKLSIQDVADNTGLSRTTISALVNENGKGIQFDTMDVLCELLKVSPGELFSYVLIKIDATIELKGENDEEVIFGDDEGNAVEIEKDYVILLTINIRCEDSLFTGNISGIIHASVNYINNTVDYTSNLVDSNLYSYLQKLPYTSREHITDAVEQDIFDFLMGLPTSGNNRAVSFSQKWDF
ncbi:helix-turn-helix domain-containing protein [Paenibacillus sp. GXUN7292]|uniref:helix-turn-helix domain-containing protein n=1 Tax=Paenibacillus sp. GXUN7292 TaxID=3422499 RepID=UPI003D7DFDEC